jgi:hypothetical protein
VSSIGDTVKVRSRLGSSKSLKTLVSTPKPVSAIAGERPIGPVWKRASSMGSSGVCADREADNTLVKRRPASVRYT